MTSTDAFHTNPTRQRGSPQDRRVGRAQRGPPCDLVGFAALDFTPQFIVKRAIEASLGQFGPREMVLSLNSMQPPRMRKAGAPKVPRPLSTLLYRKLSDHLAASPGLMSTSTGDPTQQCDSYKNLFTTSRLGGQFRPGFNGVSATSHLTV